MGMGNKEIGRREEGAQEIQRAERPLTHWYSPKVTTIARAGPCGSQDPQILLAVNQALRLASIAFPGTRAMIWIGCGTAEIQTGTLVWDFVVSGSGLFLYTMVPTIVLGILNF